MTVYRRGNTYRFTFVFGGKRIQKSTKQGNRKAAVDIESAFRTTLAKGEVGIAPPKRERRTKELIAGLVEKRVKALDLSADKVLEELVRLGFSNMLDYIAIKDGAAVVDFSRVTRDQGAAMHEITVDEYMDGSGPDARPDKRIRFKLTDKVRSLELLGRYLKLFQDGENVTQGIKVVIVNRAFRPKREPDPGDKQLLPRS